MRPTCILLSALLAGSTVLAGGQGREYLLDLTTPVAEEPRTSVSGSGCISGPVGAPVPAVAARVELISLDRSEFNLGDRFLHEVVIENSGTTDIVFPWHQTRDFLRAPQTRLDASVGLVVDYPGRNPDFAASFSRLDLQGAEDIPGSLMTLRPRERARIRSVGTARFGLLPTPDGTPARVRAELRLYVKPCWLAPVVPSVNSLPVLLRSRWPDGPRRSS